ncbi:hypothetical protein DYU11_28625 [Fibrisoma montanum]|uniref:Uncharacterized protein n=1 Tax=Fibrisoma montanum TaxID=2305895 RepID=A0A418LZ50_9BACT|nr:hypothetical protein [Fibrisoma montanum]RIV18539.1 hypothetical protein DYU11_28625 [Fibrisoma montanum]
MKNATYLLGLLFLVSACAPKPYPLGTSSPNDDAVAYQDGSEYYVPQQRDFTARKRLYPDPIGGLGRSENPNIRVTDIRHINDYTVVFMSFENDRDSRNSLSLGTTAAISFNKQARLVVPNSDRTYALLKAEGIPMSPQTRDVYAGDRANFALYFERLDPEVKVFSLIECQSDASNSCFNVFDMNVAKPGTPADN